MLIYLLYHEMTHDSPASFFHPDAGQDSQHVLKDWLREHPYGKIVVMTLQQFRHTVWYDYFQKNGWEFPADAR